MNVIAILNHMGVYFKEEPIRELHRALERLNFQIVYPNDRDDLLKLIENNARLCGVIFDWDKYNLELCEEISKMNENLPLYAFANTYSTLDVSLNDLRLQISFFEYALVVEMEDRLCGVFKVGEIADRVIGIAFVLITVSVQPSRQLQQAVGLSFITTQGLHAITCCFLFPLACSVVGNLAQHGFFRQVRLF